MSTAELVDRLDSIVTAGHGKWYVNTIFRGKRCVTTTTNSCAIDRIIEHTFGVGDRVKTQGTNYTYKQALQSLYDEVLTKIRS